MDANALSELLLPPQAESRMTPIMPQDGDPNGFRFDVEKEVVGKRTERGSAMTSVREMMARGISLDGADCGFDIREEPVCQFSGTFRLVIIQGGPEIPANQPMIDDPGHLSAQLRFDLIPGSSNRRIALEFSQTSIGLHGAIVNIR